MQVTRNISRGEPISDLNVLMKLALDKKSVVVCYGGKLNKVTPAAFVIGWPFHLIYRMQRQIFYAVKHETKDNRK